MKAITYQIVLWVLAAIGISESLSAQEKIEKTNETFSVNKNVAIDVDAKYTTLLLETWNKNEVEVEAFMEGKKLSEEEKQNLLKSWNLQVMGNSEKIEITSQVDNMAFPGVAAFANLFDEESVAFALPVMENIVQPLMAEIADIPVLDPSFYQNMGSLRFDYEAYKKEGEAYLEQYEQQIEQKFGKDFERKMEKWGKRLEERMEGRGEALKKRMEKWSEQFSKRMEARSERLQERMEQMAANDPNVHYSKTVATTPNGGKKVTVVYQNSDIWRSSENTNRTLVVRMPENAVLNLNVRHGEVQLEKARDLTANLSHTPFTASEIDGKNTRIQVSYAPVKISDWNYGVLHVSYVSDCSIDRAESIKLSSNSSDVHLGELQKTGILSGSFGELSILQVGKNFEDLRIDLENSELSLKLPSTAFDFSYSGSHSEIDFPSSLQMEAKESYTSKFISGYYQSENNSGKIAIDAEFSEVVLNE